MWSPAESITRERVPGIPEVISSLMQEVSTQGKVVE